MPSRVLHTGRLVLTPVGWGDLPALRRLKEDPLVFGQMLGGVRHAAQVISELAEDLAFWSSTGTGMWSVREAGQIIGLVGIHQRPDGRGEGLRFAFTTASRGRGLAREAAAAALRHAHDQAGLPRVVAVTRETNIGSRTVLGSIGMRPTESFQRDGERMLLFESNPPPRLKPP